MKRLSQILPFFLAVLLATPVLAQQNGSIAGRVLDRDGKTPLQGATLWAAEAIGQANDLGSIEPGRLADLTIIEGNPLTDIGATRSTLGWRGAPSLRNRSSVANGVRSAISSCTATSRPPTATWSIPNGERW